MAVSVEAPFLASRREGLLLAGSQEGSHAGHFRETRSELQQAGPVRCLQEARATALSRGSDKGSIFRQS